MDKIEAQIDELYKAPLDDFVERRSALAKSLSGSEALRVKPLRKPAVVPWAVNQVYWHDRAAFDRIRKSGEKLRRAQLGALKRSGKEAAAHAADLRSATTAHRQALADAVAAASKLAAAAGVHPSAEGLMRTFEALSLAPEPPEPPGRLTRPLQPAGFEALAGVSLPAVPARPSAETRDELPARDATALSRERERAAAEARRKRAIEQAEASVDHAQSAERRAREAWERAKRNLEAAEESLAELRGQQTSR